MIQQRCEAWVVYIAPAGLRTKITTRATRHAWRNYMSLRSSRSQENRSPAMPRASQHSVVSGQCLNMTALRLALPEPRI